MNITAILIDDEKNNLENLQQLLARHCPEIIIVSTAMNADAGKSTILTHRPDLIFLDIQMSGQNGFALLQSLAEYKLQLEVIFVTAYDKYGIQAVKFAAIDYLLKPINVDELKHAVNKAVAKSSEKKQNLQLENLLKLLQQGGQRDEHRIALTTAKETRFVKTGEIVRCESSNNYTTFFLVTGEKIIVSKPIFEYEELLEDYGFIRSHQSHLVNRKFIKSLVKEDGGYLLLDDNSQLPVSRQKKDSIKALLSKIK